MVCAACLKKLTPKALARRLGFTQIFRFAQCAVGLLVAWFFFFLIGAGLLKLPDSFHEGTLWHVHRINRE